MSNRLYAVTVQHVIVVVAEDEADAERVARTALREHPMELGDAEVDSVYQLTEEWQIPANWGIPFGDDGRDWDAVRYLPPRQP